MKARKYNHLRATVKNLRRELYTTREVINYQKLEIAALRKQLSDLNTANESELDKVINHLHKVATALRDSTQQEKRRFAMAYGAPCI